MAGLGLGGELVVMAEWEEEAAEDEPPVRDVAMVRESGLRCG